MVDADNKPGQHSWLSVQGLGHYLVCHSRRALLPQPQGWGHVFQHLEHVTVTDATTGDPARRRRGRGVRRRPGVSRQENNPVRGLGLTVNTQCAGVGG